MSGTRTSATDDDYAGADGVLIKRAQLKHFSAICSLFGYLDHAAMKILCKSAISVCYDVATSAASGNSTDFGA